MSGLVPPKRSEPSDAGILVGSAVSSRLWYSAASLSNWLAGRGAQLVPATPVDLSVVSGTTDTFRFYTKTRITAIERLWSLTLRCATTAAVTVEINPGATGIQTFAVSPSRDIRGPILVREACSPSNTRTELAITIQAIGADVNIDSIACCELPRPVLRNDGNLGTDLQTARPREKLYASGALSVLTVNGYASDARRVGIFQWVLPSSQPATTAAAYADLLTLPIPGITRLLDVGTTTANIHWSIYAKVSAGSGDVKLTSSLGATSTINVTATSYAWSTPTTLAIPTEDMTTADGRRAATWETITPSFRGVGGTLSLLSIAIWDEST